MKKSIGVIGLLIIGIGAFLIYQYPIQKHQATTNIDKYMTEQKIKPQQVAKMQFKKSFYWGGYDVKVRLKNDPHYYEYVYSNGASNGKYHVNYFEYDSYANEVDSTSKAHYATLTK
ncbi:DUF3139 domain-containing protein [Periweissella cryptocerci]|uniref:DUF3139 domain-containing protein n=1 Tax=Periweissella cryptocerci TaxID=2506420 RepID=A0A4V1AIJ1_9LACO|nr:DUF3139 domain-containing protein [Periweissella cryptocerci]QBO35685.1 DUF3139 domain-containing protein [Periweissella cryptocerci]